MSRRWPTRNIGRLPRYNASRANVCDIMASCGAWFELTTPVADQHLGELAIEPNHLAVPFDLWADGWRIESALAFGTTIVPIGFSQVTCVFAFELEVVAVKAAARHEVQVSD